MTTSQGCSVAAEFQNQAGSISHSLLPDQAAWTSLMISCNQSPWRVSMLQSQTMLTHQGCKFAEWGRECITFLLLINAAYTSFMNVYIQLSVTATRDPRPGKCHCILIPRYDTYISIEYLTTILSIYTQSLSCATVYHLIRLRRDVGVCVIPLYSIFNYRIRFIHENIGVLPLLSKKRPNRQETNSLHINSTINRLLCLLRQLPEVNCSWLVYVRAQKTYDHLLPE